MDLSPETRLDPLPALLRGLGQDTWDVALVGDGSGSGWDKPIGWGVTLVEKASGGRKVLWGGASAGTSFLAELWPYLHALAWYDAYREREPARKATFPRVAIVTDNKPVADVGNALVAGVKDLGGVNAAGPAWAALLAYRRQGYAFTFSWIPRISWALNSFADQLAENCFAAMKAVAMPELDGKEVSAYSCNADDERETPLHEFDRRPKSGRRARKRQDPED